LEIERKFLVKSSDWLADHKGISYKQGYLSTEASRTVRIRLEGEKESLQSKVRKKESLGLNLSIAYQKAMQSICLRVFAKNLL